jgi:hypothetical protein
MKRRLYKVFLDKHLLVTFISVPVANGPDQELNMILGFILARIIKFR